MVRNVYCNYPLYCIFFLSLQAQSSSLYSKVITPEGAKSFTFTFNVKNPVVTAFSQHKVSMHIYLIWTKQIVHNGLITIIIHVSMETHESRFDSLCFTSQTALIVVMRDKKWLLAFSATTQLAFSSFLGVPLCVSRLLVHYTLQHPHTSRGTSGMRNVNFTTTLM